MILRNKEIFAFEGRSGRPPTDRVNAMLPFGYSLLANNCASVFECVLDNGQCRLLQQKLRDIMDESCDSLRFYYLGNHYRNKVDHFGNKETYDPEGFLML